MGQNSWNGKDKNEFWEEEVHAVQESGEVRVFRIFVWKKPNGDEDRFRMGVFGEPAVRVDEFLNRLDSRGEVIFEDSEPGHFSPDLPAGLSGVIRYGDVYRSGTLKIIDKVGNDVILDIQTLRHEDGREEIFKTDIYGRSRVRINLAGETH